MAQALSVFENNLEIALQTRAWAQKDLSLATHINENNISRLKSAKMFHKYLGYVREIARELGVNPAWLVFGEPFDAMDTQSREIVVLLRQMLPIERQEIFNLCRIIHASHTSANDAELRSVNESKSGYNEPPDDGQASKAAEPKPPYPKG